MFGYLFELFPLFTKSSKFRFFFLAFLMAICAVLEALGIGLVLPFLAILLDESFSEKYPYIQSFLTFFNINSQTELVIYFLCFFVFIYLFKSLLLLFTYWIQYSFLMDLGLHIRNSLFKRYMFSPYDFFLSVNSAKIMRDINAVSILTGNYLTSLLTIFSEVFVIFTITILLLFNSQEAGLFLIVFFIANIYLFQLFTKKRLKYWAQIILNLSNKSIKNFHECIYGIKVIKIFGREKFFVNDFETLGKKIGLVDRNMKLFSQLPRIWLELISIFALSILIIFLILHNPDIFHVLSIIAIFVVAAFRLMPSANRLLNAINLLRSGIPATELILDEFKKNPLPITSINQDIDFKKSITLKNLSFKYQNTSNKVIDNIDLKILKGSCIGFVGKSGTGKSTLIDLIIGLLPATSGVISIDDNVINPSSRSWQKLIGYVSQNIYLTDDTIKKNIAFGLKDDQIDKKLLEYSVKASQLDEFISTLPDNLETNVGEHGVRLSGGQRQRIALARALYINPPILVFDEATSSLDSQTEVEIMSSIKKLKVEKTILIIAHRLSTLEYCDIVYELKDGKLFKNKP